MSESIDQICERIHNPQPALTHCPCGYPLATCLGIIGRERCRMLESQEVEFLKMVPEWYLTVLAKAAD